MPGFANVGEWADAIAVEGKFWIGQFRKVPAVTTIAGQWFDFTTAVGNPLPNYYASNPLAAAVFDTYKGIMHGPNVSPEKKYIHRILSMHGTASATTVTGENVEMIFMDYLLYYPFLDLDAEGDDQLTDNTVALPRYSDGAGVMMMLVAQAQTVGSGTFTVTYTNQDGTPDRVTPTVYCAAAQPSGALVHATGNAGGRTPFIPLQAGDTGVRSVQKVNVTLANGGLGSLVLVVPIQNHYQREACRRTTSGTLESFGSPQEQEAIRLRAGVSRPILDGAHLGFIGRTAAGSVASGSYMGIVETVWR